MLLFLENRIIRVLGKDIKEKLQSLFSYAYSLKEYRPKKAKRLDVSCAMRVPKGIDTSIRKACVIFPWGIKNGFPEEVT